MLDISDFEKKQIVVYSPAKGDKLSYQNDNLIIKDSNGKVKYQHTCYRIFLLIVVGDTTLTTGLIRRAKKFGFSICFMTMSFKLYAMFGAGTEGNTLLHQKQYAYDSTELARVIVKNKVYNQRRALMRIRSKTDDVRDGINLLDEYLARLDEKNLERESIVGIEGMSAKVYFSRVFNRMPWQGRKPRIKYDYVNCLLDIGYNLLFNFIDCVLQVFGFDVYQGVLHTRFYMRKSLVCDMMEPFRVIIDWRVRTGVQLGLFSKDDFIESRGQWQLEYKNSSRYVATFLEEILEHKQEIFLYVRSYYRSFMKGRSAEEFPEYDFSKSEVVYDYY